VFDFSQKNKNERGNPFCAREKKGKTPTTFFGIQQQQNELFYTHHKSLKAKKKTRKKENERRGCGNVRRGFRRRFRCERYGREIRAV
jgi:hypothetical protein